MILFFREWTKINKRRPDRQLAFQIDQQDTLSRGIVPPIS